MCGTSCRATASHCDVCEQDLRAPLDLAALHAEVREHRQKVLIGAAVALVVLGVSYGAFGGRGVAFVFLPGGSVVTSWIRWRRAAERLRRLRVAARPTTF
ncbi:MAG: hypothetical protein H6722_13010 [Sandaracinus sp.]|nr:hypothetical protein [Sandaracinus sp.]MCB9613362.1 hypothetical protein [Sandaracinus sp.]MCB9625186.1 hypothetical protein [Sandaracinus sp.]